MTGKFNKTEYMKIYMRQKRAKEKGKTVTALSSYAMQDVVKALKVAKEAICASSPITTHSVRDHNKRCDAIERIDNALKMLTEREAW